MKLCFYFLADGNYSHSIFLCKVDKLVYHSYHCEVFALTDENFCFKYSMWREIYHSVCILPILLLS